MKYLMDGTVKRSCYRKSSGSFLVVSVILQVLGVSVRLCISVVTSKGEYQDRHCSIINLIDDSIFPVKSS